MNFHIHQEKRKFKKTIVLLFRYDWFVRCDPSYLEKKRNKNETKKLKKKTGNNRKTEDTRHVRPSKLKLDITLQLENNAIYYFLKNRTHS